MIQIKFIWRKEWMCLEPHHSYGKMGFTLCFYFIDIFIQWSEYE